jgi:hypothetical protein
MNHWNVLATLACLPNTLKDRGKRYSDWTIRSMWIEPYWNFRPGLWLLTRNFFRRSLFVFCFHIDAERKSIHSLMHCRLGTHNIIDRSSVICTYVCTWRFWVCCTWFPAVTQNARYLCLRHAYVPKMGWRRTTVRYGSIWNQYKTTTWGAAHASSLREWTQMLKSPRKDHKGS